MHWLKRIGSGLGALFALLIVSGFIYQKAGAARDSALKPPANEMVSVNGHMVHVVCMGTGPHTYLLEAGHASWSFAWWRIQPLLAKTGRACAFDRPGFGWSDWVDRGYDGLSAAAELAAGDRLRQVAMRGGNHGDVDRVGTTTTQRGYLALLQHAQQATLHAQWHVAEFVEEQRAAIGLAQ